MNKRLFSYLFMGMAVVTVVATVSFLSGASPALAASVGPTITGSAVNGSTAPNSKTTNWTNPGNMTLDDGVYATFSNSASVRYASTTQYGFSIPTGSTINGIVVEVKQQASADDPGNVGYITDNAIFLMKSGATVGSNKARASTTHWSTTAGYITYGSSSDLWGTTWTAEDVNSTTFGVAFSGAAVPVDGAPQGRVDAIRVTVYYTAGSGSPGITSDLVMFE